MKLNCWYYKILRLLYIDIHICINWINNNKSTLSTESNLMSQFLFSAKFYKKKKTNIGGGGGGGMAPITTGTISCKLWNFPKDHRYFWRKVNIWIVNCARATEFIFDTRTDVLVKVSKFLRQKISRPEGHSNPKSSDSCRMETNSN